MLLVLIGMCRQIYLSHATKHNKTGPLKLKNADIESRTVSTSMRVIDLHQVHTYISKIHSLQLTF